MSSESGSAEARAGIELVRLGLSEISADLLAQLKRLYSQTYYNSHMYDRLLEDIAQQPAVFQLFLARLYDHPHDILGARIIESKSHSFVEYHGFVPIHGKRFSILPPFRGRGIGKRLVAEGNRFVFDELNLKVIFGESKEIGALSMYGREGALYFLESIRTYSSRNSPSENVEFFRALLADPKFRPFRLPTDKAIQLVYCRDAETSATFEQHGYVSQEALLGDCSERISAV